MDFSDDAVLHSYLIANEVNLQGYERDELVALAKSLAESNGESFIESELNQNVAELPSADTAATSIPTGPPSPPHRADRGIGISSLSSEQLNEINTTNNSNNNDTNTANNNNINIENNNEVTSEQDEKIQQFCGITNSESSYAHSLLESTNWNLEMAISLAMDMGVGAMSPTPPHVPTSAPLPYNIPPMSPMSGLAGMSLPGMQHTMNQYETNFPNMPNPPGVGNPNPSNTGDDVDGLSSGMSNMNVNDNNNNDGTRTGTSTQSNINDFFQPSSIGGSGYNGLNNNNNMASSTRNRQPRRDEYDDEGIRYADSSYQERLLDGYGDDRNNGFGNIRSRGSTNSLNANDGQAQDDPLARAEDSSVQWIVPPPSHLSYPCGWGETRSHAKLDKKWILVNIQLHTNFQSHELNSYTWSDETVESLIRENFVFWQRGSTSPDAQGFINMYRIQDDQMPYICIIDARTGAQMLTCKGYLSPQKFAMEIFDFMDYHNSGGGLKVKHLDCSKDRAVTYDSTPGTGADDEDEDENYDYESDNNDGNSNSLISENPFSPLSDEIETDANDVCTSSLAPFPVPAPAPNGNDINSNDTSSSSSSSSLSRVETEVTEDEVKVKEVVDYGLVPDEPTTGGCRIKLSLANSTSSDNSQVTVIKRKFNSDDPVRALFAVAKAGIINREKNDTSNNDSIHSDINRKFDLYTTFPRKQLSLLIDQSLRDAELENAQVLMQWVEEEED